MKQVDVEYVSRSFISFSCCCLLLLPCQFVMDGVFHLVVVSNVETLNNKTKNTNQHFKIQKSQPTSSFLN